MKKHIFSLIILGAVMCLAPHCLAAETAQPSDAAVTVNGKSVQIAAYNMYGSNYFKLRDVAAALNGTDKQFNVDWLASYEYILLDDTQGYEESEAYTAPQTGQAQYNVITMRKNDGDGFVSFNPVCYNINDNNYFKIRDISKIFDFDVNYVNGILNIDTENQYTAVMPEEEEGELIGMAYEAALPLFINEIPLVSYYSPCETVHTVEDMYETNPRLNGVYVDAKNLANYGFDVTEDDNGIYLTRNCEKGFKDLDTETINSAPTAEYKVYGAIKKVYLDGEEVRCIETENTSLIAANELIKYGDIETRNNVGGFPVNYDSRINLDFLATELHKAYDEADEEKEISWYSEEDELVQAEYKPSAGIGTINITAFRSGTSEYIGGCNGITKDGIGICTYKYDPHGGAGLAPTRYTGFMRGTFKDDELYDGIGYRQITYGGESGGVRTEGARVDGYQRVGTIMRIKNQNNVGNDYNLDTKHFRFGYRITHEGEVRNGEFSGAYKAYDLNGELIFDGQYEDYVKENE